MECRVIVLYGVYQVSDSDRSIKLLPDLSYNRLLWSFSRFDLPTGEFPATFEFSVTSCRGKYFCFVLYGIADYGCDYANGFHTALFSFEILLCKYLNKSSRTG